MGIACGANVPFIMLPGAGDTDGGSGGGGDAVAGFFSPLYNGSPVLFMYIIHVSVSPRPKTPSIRRFRIGNASSFIIYTYNIYIYILQFQYIRISGVFKVHNKYKRSCVYTGGYLDSRPL